MQALRHLLGGERAGHRRAQGLLPLAIFAQAGMASPPSARYSSASRSTAARILLRVRGGCRMTSPAVRTLPPSIPCQSSSASATRWVSETIRTSTPSRPAPRSSSPELVVVGEAIGVGTRRARLRAGHAAGPNRVDQDAEEAVALGQVPGRERNPSSRRHDARELPHRELGPRQVVDREVAHERVEGALREGEVLGVRRQEADPGMTPARERQHLVGDVHTRRDRAALAARGGVPRTRPHVEHAHARADSGRVEQRLHEPGGDPAGEAAVGLGLRVPAGPLERLEGLGVTRHQAVKSDLPRTTMAPCRPSTNGPEASRRSSG